MGILLKLLSKLKDSDWEIIKLKLNKDKVQYIILMLPFLFLCGMIYYYSIEPHPKFLDVFWNKYGFLPKYWIYFWVIVGVFIFWIKLTHSEPSEELVRWYIDKFDENEPKKLSSLFKRYENYFFSKKKNASKTYSILLDKEEFWYMISNSQKEWLRKNPKRLVYGDNLKTFLSPQLSNLPNSPIAKELENQSNGVNLSDDTPILNIYLIDKHAIENSIDSSYFISIIDGKSRKYFSSLKFLKKEKEYYVLKPSDNDSHEVAPENLVIFYYIQLINCYWSQLIAKKSEKINSWPAYERWTKHLLKEAPIVVEVNLDSDKLPNHYILAVDKMFSNISDWVRKIEKMLKEESKQDAKDKKVIYKECIQNFNDLKIAMIFEIQENHLNKVSETWLQEKKEKLLEEIIHGKELLNEKYDKRKIMKLLQRTNLENAFKSCTDRYFYSYERKEESEIGKKYKAWKWLKIMIGVKF